jgi:uncharacterized membrane protein (UPF0127 family)
MKRNLIIGGVALVLLLISIKFFPYHCNCVARHAATPTVQIGDNAINVDIADTKALQEQGLSGRMSICADLPAGRQDCGMLFTFDTPGDYGFWMKDMNFPLDIVWISSQKVILGVEKNLATSTYPQIYHPPAPVSEVLELQAGYFDAHQLEVGEVVTLVSQK